MPTPQVGADGKVYYIDSEGDSGGWKDYLFKHLPRAVGQTFGEAITPSLNKIGGGSGRDAANVGSARDYIADRLLKNKGGESIPEALVKGAGEGVANVFVPETGVDLQSNVLAESSGGILSGANSAVKAKRALDETKAAKNAARSSASSKLQARQRAPKETWQGGGPGNKPPGYHTRRAQVRDATRAGEGLAQPKYRGPRPTDREVEQFSRGTGGDVGIPTESRPALDASRRASEAHAVRSDPVKGHQLNMAVYRMKMEQAADAAKQMGLPPPPPNTPPDEAMRIMENAIMNRAQRAPSASPQEIKNLAQGGEAIPLPPPKNPSTPAPMGFQEPGNLEQLLQAESDGKVARQIRQMEQLPPQDQSDLMAFMQKLLSSNPNMTMQEFMQVMSSISGGIF
jgi:hypothetical protein